jgi:ribokinase
MSVFNFGSINIDFVYQVPHLVQPGETLSSTHYQSVLGGKGANQSIALAKAGVNTLHVGAVNKNDRSFVEQMNAYGVDCSLVKLCEDEASGHAIIQVDANAENSIILFGGANQTFEQQQIDNALVAAHSSDYLLIQNEINALDQIMKSARDKNMKIVFNPAPMTPSVHDLPLNYVDLFVLNEIEAEQISGHKQLGDIKAALLENFPNSSFVITLGKSGACYFNQDQDVSVDAFVVDAVDTTAAGDTFIGFFLAGLEQNKEIKEALSFACAASALSVTKSGAAQSIPDLKDVNHFLLKHK